jgi:hypothetical protein
MRKVSNMAEDIQGTPYALPEDSDTFSVELTPAQLQRMGVAPEKVLDGEQKDAKEDDAPADAEKPAEDGAKKEVTKAAEDKAEPTKESPEDDNKVARLFELNKKEEAAQKKPEAQPLTEDERTELMTLKAEKESQVEKTAFSAALADYSQEELDIIAPTLAKLINSETYDNLDKLKPEQRALALVSLAKESNEKALKEIRAKSEQAKLEQAKQESKARKVIKEVADLHSEGSAEESPKQKRARLEKAAANGDDAALRDLLVSDDDVDHLLRGLR